MKYRHVYFTILKSQDSVLVPIVISKIHAIPSAPVVLTADCRSIVLSLMLGMKILQKTCILTPHSKLFCKRCVSLTLRVCGNSDHYHIQVINS